MTAPNNSDHTDNKQELNNTNEISSEEFENKVHSEKPSEEIQQEQNNEQPDLSKNEPVINQEKFLEALMAYGDEKRMQGLDYKMMKELDAGLYCLNCCSDGLVKLLRAFCWTELELLTFAQLDESYRHIIADTNIILNYNEDVKEYIKGRGYYDELLNLTKLFPEVLTEGSMRTTNWVEAMDAVHRFSVIISKICYVETYTPPLGMDDSFISRLRDMNEYISIQWEDRELRTDKKTIKKVKMTKRIDGDINSKLKRFGARNKDLNPSVTATKRDTEHIQIIENKVTGLKPVYKLGELIAFEDGSIDRLIKSDGLKFTSQLKAIHKSLIKKYGEWIDLKSLKSYLKSKASPSNIKKRLITLNDYLIKVSQAKVKKIVEVNDNACRLKAEVLEKCIGRVAEKV